MYRINKWWRWRELNPRPEILPSRIYMLSSRFKSRIRLSSGTGDCQMPACLSLVNRVTGNTRLTSPKSRRFAPALRARAGEAAKQTMLPLRNYNRQRLYLRFHQVYELTEHSACNVELTYPRRIRFTPIRSLKSEIRIAKFETKTENLKLSHFAAALAAGHGWTAFLSKRAVCHTAFYLAPGQFLL